MKLALLLGGFLLITLGGHVESNNFERWMEQIEDEEEARAERLEAAEEAKEERLEAAEEAREKQLEAAEEAKEERLEAAEEAREKQLEAAEEAKEERLEAAEEAREKQFEAELDKIRQKCAKKGFTGDTQGYSNQMVSYNTYSINGFQHIYVHTYNPATKKASGSYYRINLNDPKAEPVCGKLNTE